MLNRQYLTIILNIAVLLRKSYGKTRVKPLRRFEARKIAPKGVITLTFISLFKSTIAMQFSDKVKKGRKKRIKLSGRIAERKHYRHHHPLEY